MFRLVPWIFFTGTRIPHLFFSVYQLLGLWVVTVFFLLQAALCIRVDFAGAESELLWPFVLWGCWQSPVQPQGHGGNFL